MLYENRKTRQPKPAVEFLDASRMISKKSLPEG